MKCFPCEGALKKNKKEMCFWLLSTFYCNFLTVEFYYVLLSSERDVSGCSSVGRVQASQAWGREFEPRRPLQCR